MRIEDFFDLRIAAVEPGETPPPDAHWIRIEDPLPPAVRDLAGKDWFYKPLYVTYFLGVPGSLEEYIRAAFSAAARSHPRKLLREVPKKYRLQVDDRMQLFPLFQALYRRTIVARPRGKDRLAEHDEGFGQGWVGMHLFAGDALVAGILSRLQQDHLSVAYGAFDPDHRALDLEHFLLMQALQHAIDRRVPWMTLGMDTNRYGHHLSLGLPSYKMRLGFTPAAFDSAGRELVRVQRFDPFEGGLFFYAYADKGIEGHLFSRGVPDLRPFRHPTAPPIVVHQIG